MSEQEFNPEQDKISQEKDLESKIKIFLKKNQGTTYTSEALLNRLLIYRIIEDPDDKEYVKENIQEILKNMGNNGIIDTVEQSGETHYLIKKPEEKAPDKQATKFKSILDRIKSNPAEDMEMLLLIGILIAIGIFLSGYFLEILISLSVILITISLLYEGFIVSKQSKENLKYDPPIYGIVALVFDVIGLIILIIFTSGSIFLIFEGFGSLYSTPLLVAAIICSIGGFYFHKDARPYLAVVGLFFGIILFIISLGPLWYLLVSLIGGLLMGGG